MGRVILDAEVALDSNTESENKFLGGSCLSGSPAELDAGRQ